ncbi:hypothetical protein [Pseudomonas fluorescens group sp. PF-69]
MRQKINKSKQIEDSILATIKLLEITITTPNQFIDHTIIRHALKSQGGVASLEYTFDADDTSYCIKPLSITTLKSKISTISEGLTWETFDQLRVQAHDAIEHAAEKKTQGQKETKIGLKESLADAGENLEKQREINFRLLQAIGQAVTALESISSTSDGDLRVKRARDAIEMILRCLSLNEFPFNKVERTASILTLHQEKKP